MIGLKSASAIALVVALVAIAAIRGALAPTYLASLAGSSCFIVGLVASLVLGLVGVGWRFGVRSRGALALVGGRPAVIDDASDARELPEGVQRLLVLIGLVAIVLGALGNHAAARIVRLPEDLGAPSPSAYCLPKSVAELAAPPPPPQAPAADQAGCALVKRAFALGYAKTLGSCAPKTVAAAAPVSPIAKLPVCLRRQLDEPYLHYAYRRLAEAFGSMGSRSPGDVVAKRIDDTRAHLDHAEDLLADVRHAITGSPHASHHLWVSLPDPHPISLYERFTGVPRCSTRFADLPLWPHWKPGDEARLVEHVLGQLLFASRFGTAASCSDYTIHWGAPPDACKQLVADPPRFLRREGALASVHAVLDRRRRQIALAELDAKLGRRQLPAPPAPSALVSLACLSVGPTRSAGRTQPTGTMVRVDGELAPVRDLAVAVQVEGGGPIELYQELAALLAGTELPVARASRGELGFDSFALVKLEALVDADPFAGERWALERPELVEVFPFEPHLHTFVEDFRRRYLAQRGRL